MIRFCRPSQESIYQTSAIDSNALISLPYRDWSRRPEGRTVQMQSARHVSELWSDSILSSNYHRRNRKASELILCGYSDRRRGAAHVLINSTCEKLKASLVSVSCIFLSLLSSPPIIFGCSNQISMNARSSLQAPTETQCPSELPCSADP
jgi:hypothetical protein